MNARTLWLVLALVSTLGCERIAVIKKCRALAQRVNPELEAIRSAAPSTTASSDAKRDAASYRAIAKRYAALAKELQTARIDSAEIDRSLQDYAGTLRATGTRLDEFATSLDNASPGADAQATRSLEQELRRQKSAAKRFTQECQGH
ncbi:MAG TPA: hypothetical protein VGK73_21670 [Polyangiaceae bacterium]